MSVKRDHFRIRHVSEVTGIPRQTLISWERRHGLVTPDRTENGYRYYSRDDIELLQRVKAMLAEGYRISEVAALLDAGREQVSTGIDRVREELGLALRSFDARRVHTVHAQLVAVPLEDRVQRVYLPLLRWIGTEWESGRASVAEEHHVSAFCRGQMMAILTALSRPEGTRTIAAGFPGEGHESGLMGVAIQMALRGMCVTYLGPDVPAPDLADAVRSSGARLVVQSMVMPVSQRDLARHLRSLRPLLPEDCLLALGGPGMPQLTLVPEGVHLGSNVDELIGRLSHKR